MFVKTLPLGSGSSSADQTPAQAPGVQRFLLVMRHLFVFICDEIEPDTLVARRS